MEFANLISTLRQEKEERALERGQRDKAIKKKAADLLRSLQQGIEVHRIDRAKASADHQDVAAMIVERGGESIKVVVVAPDKFSITRYMGAEDCKTLTFADEDETMRAIGLWLCPDLKDLSASEHQRLAAQSHAIQADPREGQWWR